MESRFHLLFVEGDRHGDEIPLVSERFTIGRKEKNDLSLADSRISGVHAEISQEGDSWILRDLGSTNGTLLDGRKIEEVPLAHGDIFSVGLVRLRFVDGEGGPLTEESEEVQVARVDEDALSRAGQQRRSMLPLILLLILVAGGGAWVYLEYGQKKESRSGPTGPLKIAGNLLPAAVAAMEDGGIAAWEGDKGSRAFRHERGLANSGEGSFIAGLDGEGEAILTLTQRLKVKPGRNLCGGAYIKVSDQDTRVSLHLLFYQDEQALVAYRLPSILATAGPFQKIMVNGIVPASCSEVSIQVVATGSSGEVSVDDVFFLSGKKTDGQRIKPANAPAAEICWNDTLLTISQPGGPRIVTMAPVLFQPGARGAAEAALRRLGRHPAGEGLVVMDQAGRSTTVLGKAEPTSTGATLQWTCKDDGNGLKPRLLWGVPEGVKTFPISAKEGDGKTGLRLKAGNDAVLISWEYPVDLKSTALVGGRRFFHLPLPMGKVTFQVGFNKEKLEAAEILSVAKDELAKNNSGKALVQLKRILNDLPYQENVLSEASKLSSDIVARGMKSLEELKQKAEEVKIFSSADQLEALLEQAKKMASEFAGADRFAEGAEKVAAEAVNQLADIRKAANDREYERLSKMLASEGLSPVLRGIIDKYIDRYLSAARQRAGK